MDLPIYSSRDIRVLDHFRGILKVQQVDGKEMICKCPDPSLWQAVGREFECLRTIATALSIPSSSETHSPCRTRRNRKLVAILEEYIFRDPDKAFTFRLQEIEISTISERRRKRWIVQVRQTVDQLHAIGIVWGACRPHNVLISSDTDDAWLINFGRGSTDDWVGEIMETKESDVLAVEKIVVFLDV